MATKTSSITIEVRLAWWLMPYVQTLAFFCVLMDAEPDQEKLARVIERGVRVRFC